MQLTGTVILDKETMKELKGKVREEVVADIQKNGSYYDEIEKYLNNTTFQKYVSIIESTIDNVIKNSHSATIFQSDVQTLHKLLAIKSVLDI